VKRERSRALLIRAVIAVSLEEGERQEGQEERKKEMGGKEENAPLLRQLPNPIPTQHLILHQTQLIRQIVHVPARARSSGSSSVEFFRVVDAVHPAEEGGEFPADGEDEGVGGG
jgi:hypothetical protein